MLLLKPFSVMHHSKYTTAFPSAQRLSLFFFVWSHGLFKTLCFNNEFHWKLEEMSPWVFVLINPNWKLQSQLWINMCVILDCFFFPVLFLFSKCFRSSYEAHVISYKFGSSWKCYWLLKYMLVKWMKGEWKRCFTPFIFFWYVLFNWTSRDPTMLLPFPHFSGALLLALCWHSGVVFVEQSLQRTCSPRSEPYNKGVRLQVVISTALKYSLGLAVCATKSKLSDMCYKMDASKIL